MPCRRDGNLKIKMLCLGSTKSLEDFHYSDMEMADLITKSLKETEFMGMGSYVKFDAGGGIRPSTVIEQQRGKW